MMRSKLVDYGIEKSQISALDISEVRRKSLLKSQINLDSMEIEEEAIAQEENPFDGAMLGVGLILES